MRLRVRPGYERDVTTGEMRMWDFPAVAMGWRDSLFAHWPVERSRVRPLVPDELDVDAREGTAWVSALPSVVTAARPFVFPRSVGLTFPQVNLRTYVRHETRPGVYFLSLDTTTALGVRVARSLYGLPYYRANVDFETEAETRRFDSQRVHTDDPSPRFSATYRPTGPPSRADSNSDSLDDFLAERYRTYAVRDGTVWCARVEHRSWPLCPAEATVYADSLFEAAGLPPPAEDPLVRYSPGVEMTVRTPFRP